MAVYDEGTGNYPAPGQFINYKQRVYYQGENRDIDRRTHNITFGKNNPQPIFQILAISKARFKARAILSWNQA